MTNEATVQIITANDLLSGEVVYLSASGKWSPDHGDAVMFDDIQADTRLAEVQKLDTSVVGPYLAGATQGGGDAPSPIHFREVFRTKGPSNRFLGKQAHAV